MASPTVTVLMVAEKPSLAGSLANILSHGTAIERRERPTSVHEWSGHFQGHHALFKFTSVTGHVYSLDFLPEFNNWDTTLPVALFNARAEKKEERGGMSRHLQTEAKGANYLVLWLDCDREGENICFEVIDIVKRVLGRPLSKDRQISRAKFSAITDRDIHAAMADLGEPNKNEALSVDARQELDLRMGCAFTRFQTRFFQGKYGDLDSTVISYGPCQTPTLGLCVDRHDKILRFKPEKYWTIVVRVRCGVGSGGRGLALEWARGRVFENEVGAMLLRPVSEANVATVLSVVRKEKCRTRPTALNTVEMMRVCSSGLGMGPHHAMGVAERLYIQGYISYPRTETSAYPANFDLKEVLQALTKSPSWGREAKVVLDSGIVRPKAGQDHGDHPPITPLRLASERDLSGDAWSVYDMIARHFIATLSGDMKYLQTTATFDVSGEIFKASGKQVTQRGFTAVMHWLAPDEDEIIPQLSEGIHVEIESAVLDERFTQPAGPITESELLSLMDKFGIGTDASMAVHINNICERNYVSIGPGRTLVPTNLGVVLVHGYQQIDRELVMPTMRAAVEKRLNLIATGEADYLTVLRETLAALEAKFRYFELKISAMDELFEASFSPLADTGKPMSRCAHCGRFMKYIAAKPARLYCPTCDTTYSLPNNGKIMLFKELKCPLDGFELLLFSTGSKGKSYPLCPYCYNNPPFPGMIKGSGCDSCTHPTCQHSLIKHGVCPCVECDTGVLVLDPNSAPKYKMACNVCNVVITLFDDAHRITVSGDICGCGSGTLDVVFNKNKSPLEDGDTELSGCPFCHELLSTLIQVKRGAARHPMHRRGRGGRGRGRGGRGRGGKGKMSQLDNYFV